MVVYVNSSVVLVTAVSRALEFERKLVDYLLPCMLFIFYCLKKVACMVNCELSLGLNIATFAIGG